MLLHVLFFLSEVPSPPVHSHSLCKTHLPRPPEAFPDSFSPPDSLLVPSWICTHYSMDAPLTLDCNASVFLGVDPGSRLLEHREHASTSSASSASALYSTSGPWSFESYTSVLYVNIVGWLSHPHFEDKDNKVRRETPLCP